MGHNLGDIGSNVNAQNGAVSGRALGLAGLLACASALLGGCGCGGDAPTPRAPANLVAIGEPRDGSSTAGRSADVAGSIRAPSSGYQVVTVTVNGRRVEPRYRPDRFRARVALELGDNAITAEAGFYGVGGQRLGVVRSPVVHVTRTAGEDTGDLDLATAFLAATSATRSLCDPRRGCITDAYCFAVGPRRVDCPVGRSTDAAPASRCRVVVSVRLRGRRVGTGTYGCHGVMSPRPERLVRPSERPAIQPFRGPPSPAANRYGPPRLAAAGTTFLP
jgi:hypothetical protein